MMTWAQLNQHDKPILIANINGFWDPLVAQFERMDNDGFLHKRFLDDAKAALPVRFCETTEEIIPTLREAIAELSRPALEAPSARVM